jgi:hypothetical protein
VLCATHAFAIFFFTIHSPIPCSGMRFGQRMWVDVTVTDPSLWDEKAAKEESRLSGDEASPNADAEGACPDSTWAQV